MTKVKMKYAGYWNIGSSNKIEAQEKHGLQIFTTKKPNTFRQFMFWFCFNIVWVEEIIVEPLSELEKDLLKNK